MYYPRIHARLKELIERYAWFHRPLSVSAVLQRYLSGALDHEPMPISINPTSMTQLLTVCPFETLAASAVAGAGDAAASTASSEPAECDEVGSSVDRCLSTHQLRSLGLRAHAWYGRSWIPMFIKEKCSYAAVPEERSARGLISSCIGSDDRYSFGPDPTEAGGFDLIDAEGREFRRICSLSISCLFFHAQNTSTSPHWRC